MKVAVEKLYPSLLNADDVLFIAGSVVPVIGDLCVGDAGVEQMLSDVNTSIEKLQAAVDRNGPNELTPLLEKLDKERMRALGALRYYLISLTLRKDKPKKAEAAEIVLRTIRQTVAGVRTQGYSVRSVRYQILIEKLELPGNSDLLGLIDGQPLVENFKNANGSFEATYRKRAENMAETDTLRKDEAKGITMHYLNILFTHIGYQKEKIGGTWNTLVDTLNEVVGSTTTSARARKARELNGKPEQDTTQETELSAE